MFINGKLYKFYEVLDVEYVLAVAENEQVVIDEYIKSINNWYGTKIDKVEEIYEVPYEYAKRKFELNPEISNYPHLKNSYYTFDKLVEYIVNENNEDECFLLMDTTDE